MVGYKGEDVIQSIIDHGKISIKTIDVLELSVLKRISIVHALVKGVLLLFSILSLISSLTKYDLIVIQNPPCLPAVASAAFLSIFNGSAIMIDWHNLGFKMFEERLGPSHMLVRLARLLEWIAAKFASHHICVSEAMKVWLWENFGVRATVLYDRPATMFQSQPLTTQQRHELFVRCGLTAKSNEIVTIDGETNSEGSVKSGTIQTLEVATAEKSATVKRTKQRKAQLADSASTDALNSSFVERTDSDRAALVISSTSWTADEDFTVLLRALLVVEAFLKARDEETMAGGNSSGARRGGRSKSITEAVKNNENSYYSKLVVAITGKGPMREAFEQSVAENTRQGLLGTYVSVRLLWLSHADYPLLMRSASLGVCLHTSTSGLDLPMKVYDMLGSGVPVLAVRFATIGELVKEHVNGQLFSTDTELASQLIRLLVDPTHSDGSGSSGKSLSELRRGAATLGNWDDNWNAVMPLALKKYLQ